MADKDKDKTQIDPNAQAKAGTAPTEETVAQRQEREDADARAKASALAGGSEGDKGGWDRGRAHNAPRSSTGRPLRENERRERPPLPNMDAPTFDQMRNAPSMNAAPDYSEEDEDADLVSVINHEPRLIVWPDLAIREDDKPDGRVLGTIPGPRLIPGRNNVPREYLERMRLEGGDHTRKGSHPHVGKHFKHRMVTIGGDVEDPEGPGKPDDLTKVPAKGAKVLIAEETDPDVLERWSISERRPDVSRLIADRQREIGRR